MKKGDDCAHLLTGEVGIVEAVGSGRFENHIRVRWNLTGELYYHRKDFITGEVSRAAEIKRAHRKNRPIPEGGDDE